ncbi:MAG: metallophosphoesterase [Verrucomicrobiota bacterium]|jgi:putative phosphoesterase|nr:metallophosphoesterase [Verrucomicrobiota bacterium]
MKIGLLSDTHNHLPETRHALALLMAQNVGHCVHCGDVGEDILPLLSAACVEGDIRAHVALGNCDAPSSGALRFLPQGARLEMGRVLTFELEGHACAAVHGDDARLLATLLQSQAYAYLFTGHTHQPTARREGRTWLLNPGSPARPRNGPATVAVLDLATGNPIWLPC